MRKIKILFITGLCMTTIFFVSACSGTGTGSSSGGTDEDTAVAGTETETETEAETVIKEYDTFEEYLENNQYQLAALESVAESYDAEITCEGDNLTMTVVIEDVSEGDVSMYASVFEAALSDSSVQDEFDEMREEMVSETGYEITITCRYVTTEGTLIYETTFE